MPTTPFALFSAPVDASAPKSRRRRITMLAGAALLAGCAGMPGRSRLPEAGAIQPKRSYHETITLGGRLSVRYQQNGQNESVHGSFVWRQQADETRIALRSPTGQTLAEIAVSPGMSVLTQAGRPPRQAANVDSLAADTLGWPLPVSGLRDWLQGFAIDRNGRQFVALPGMQDAVITQDGWQIRYDSWHSPDDPAMAPRPRRIDLERMTEQAGPVELRIVIDDWQAQ